MNTNMTDEINFGCSCVVRSHWLVGEKLQFESSQLLSFGESIEPGSLTYVTHIGWDLNFFPL